MGKQLKPTPNNHLSPFRDGFGDVIGNGQDNTVREFVGEAAGKLVVKIGKQKGEAVPSEETAFQSALYKKKKYEILHKFLGDFVPWSGFLVGHKTDGIRPQTVPKAYTVQEQIPQFKISDLTVEQQNDPRLLRQLYVLTLKLKNMYNALDAVNAVVDDSNHSLDGKLDLGGISKYAQREFNGRNFDGAHIVSEFGSSPNLLVNPDTMRLYCIDFDDGVWSDEKEAAKGVLEYVADTEPYQHIIQMSPDLPPEA